MAAQHISPAFQSAMVWEIDRGASHGEVSTRHWFWGRHASGLEMVDGTMSMRSNEWLRLNLVMQSAAHHGASVMIEFASAEFRRDDYGRFTVKGEFRIDDVACAGELRLHDLGASGASRRFATIAGDLAMPAAGRRIWRRAVTGRHLTVFAHTEWEAHADTATLSWQQNHAPDRQV